MPKFKISDYTGLPPTHKTLFGVSDAALAAAGINGQYGGGSELAQAYQRINQLESEMKEWAARIVSLLGPASGFNRDPMGIPLQKDLYKAVTQYGHPFEMYGAPKTTMAFDDVTKQAPHSLDYAERVIKLFAMTVNVEDDHVAGCLRVRLMAGGGQAAYALSYQALQNIMSGPAINQVAYDIGNQLAHTLGDWLKKG